jgi:uncharacterized membrane protein
VKRREDLTTPRAAGRVGVSYDSDTFGRFSESIANFLGTARFLVWQTGVITFWILFNTVIPVRFQFDPWDRGLVLLTLVLSIQGLVRRATDPARTEPSGATRPCHRTERP